MTTKVTDSVMDLTDVRQDITLGFNDDAARQSKVVGLDTPTQDDEAASKKYVDDTIAALIQLQVPTGMGPLPWSTDTAPPGWLLCDGAPYDSVSDTSLAALFTVIGTTYGGTGANNFNVPDLRGRLPMGRNTSGSGTNRVNRTASNNLAGVSGQENYELELTHLPSHSHSANIAASGEHNHSSVTVSDGGLHSHATSPASPILLESGSGSVTSGGGGTQQAPLSIVADGLHSHTVTVPVNSSSHTHPVTIGFTTAPTAHENTPPFLTINYIIKT